MILSAIRTRNQGMASSIQEVDGCAAGIRPLTRFRRFRLAGTAQDGVKFGWRERDSRTIVVVR